MRTLISLTPAPARHWVGNGFHVSPVFSHMGEKRQTSPFLMFDYAMPQEFAPNFAAPRGVGEHPHRGFETVTIAYHGEVAHRDGSSAAGVIQAGDVQWMTAGAGTVHEEFHSEAFSRAGGLFEMAQIWVNLPRAHKNAPPRYQHLRSENIPVVNVDGGAIRLIAGSLNGINGAADTFTELNIWDVRVHAGASLTLGLPANHNLAVLVRQDDMLFNDTHRASAAQLAIFEREAGAIRISNTGDAAAELILLSGVPIDEPIAAYGPFVMNTPDEIRESIELFRAGKLGALA